MDYNDIYKLRNEALNEAYRFAPAINGPEIDFTPAALRK
jgi:hypothetical protein